MTRTEGTFCVSVSEVFAGCRDVLLSPFTSRARTPLQAKLRDILSRYGDIKVLRTLKGSQDNHSQVCLPCHTNFPLAMPRIYTYAMIFHFASDGSKGLAHCDPLITSLLYCSHSRAYPLPILLRSFSCCSLTPWHSLVVYRRIF